MFVNSTQIWRLFNSYVEPISSKVVLFEMFESVIFLVLLNMFTKVTESVQVDSKEIEVEQVADYTDFNSPRLQKETLNVRENFLHDKKEKDVLRDLDRLITNNTVYIDSITHYEVVPEWKKVADIEDEFKELITMKYMKYVYQRDAHWRTWRVVNDDEGQKKIICYKCQSMIHENCTDCDGRGVWVIEEGIPPCPYELFSLINGNEICAANYTQLNGELDACPGIIKYADLTKTCNNPIVTRWRFIRNYKIPGRPSNVICEGRDYCEMLTLYQIKPEYVVFRIINNKNNIIYSRVMAVNKKNFVCTTNCGNIDIKNFEVSKSNIVDLQLASSLSQKKKRNSQTQKKQNTIEPSPFITEFEKKRTLTLKPSKSTFGTSSHNSKSKSIKRSDKKIFKPYSGFKFISNNPQNPRIASTQSTIKKSKRMKEIKNKKKKNKILTYKSKSENKHTKKIKKSAATEKTVVTSSKPPKPRIGVPFANNTKSAWLRKDTGYYVREEPIAFATTHKSKCKKLIEKDMEANGEFDDIFSAYYDSDERVRKKFITFY